MCEHKVLLKIYGKTCEVLEEERRSNISVLLQVFLVTFNDHALKEFTNLYILLDLSYAGDRKTVEQIRRFKMEKQQIGKQVGGFCHAWATIKQEDLDLVAFGRELSLLGDVLSRRIVTKELKLYPLYQNVVQMRLEELSAQAQICPR